LSNQDKNTPYKPNLVSFSWYTLPTKKLKTKIYGATVNLFHGFDAETDNLCGCITAFISQVVVEITTFIWKHGCKRKYGSTCASYPIIFNVLVLWGSTNRCVQLTIVNHDR
jgi:hypothetical protein